MMMLQKNKLKLVIFSLVIIIGLSASFIFTRLNYDVPILMYHALDFKSIQDAPQLVVSAKKFQEQMDFLKKHHYKVIPLEDLINIIKDNRPLPRKSVVITFDDGYLDNYINGFPILKKHNFSAIIFIIVEEIGLHGYMDLAQIKELIKNNISIGSHTLTHKYLPNASEEELMREIKYSKIVLESYLNQPVNIICYPTGGFTPKVQKFVKDAGYIGACSTNRALNNKIKKNKDIYALRRIKITDKDSLFKFRLKVSGYYHLFKKIKNPA